MGTPGLHPGTLQVSPGYLHFPRDPGDEASRAGKLCLTERQTDGACEALPVPPETPDQEFKENTALQDITSQIWG
jgi:hypothetical protein